jgi:hypothetical protein
LSTRLCKLTQKRFTRLAAASDKVHQLLAHGRWFSPDTPSSSTTKTGRHDIAQTINKQYLKMSLKEGSQTSVFIVFNLRIFFGLINSGTSLDFQILIKIVIFV